MAIEVSLPPLQFGYEDGDRLEVFPIVTNTADNQVTDTIELSVDGTVRTSREVTFDAGEQKHIKLAWEVSTSSDKRVPLSVSSSDDSTSNEVTLRVYDDDIEVSVGPTDYAEDYVG